MAAAELDNANPEVRERAARADEERSERELVESARDPVDEAEVFDHIRDITDPEHPYSLEQLSVVSEDSVHVDDEAGIARVYVTPTVQHCSMATLIGLCCKVKLIKSLPGRFKVDVRIAPGAHASEEAINKQLADKERVSAALENPALLNKVAACLNGSPALFA